MRLRAAGQATPTQSSRQTQGDPLAATLKMNSEMLVAPMTDAGRVGGDAPYGVKVRKFVGLEANLAKAALNFRCSSGLVQRL